MPRSALQRIAVDRLREDRGGGHRYLDMAIELRVRDTEELLIRVGGRWDRKRKRYVGPAEKSVVLHVHAGQVESARWFCKWLRGYIKRKHGPETERVWTLGLVGGRRGGKSYNLCAFIALAFVAIPGGMLWLVSPTQAETDELKDWFDAHLPSHWYRWRDDPHWRYTGIGGARIWLRTGFHPSALKRGRADIVGINEAQKTNERVRTTVRPATADTGGLVILAANPPESPIGQWVEDFHERTRAHQLHARVFNLDPRLNPIPAAESLEDMKAEVDDRTYRREVLGEFLPNTDAVFYGWSRLNVIAPQPGTDVTEQVMRRLLGLEGIEQWIGCDFQLMPHQVGIVERMHATCPHYDDPASTPGEPVWERREGVWMEDECIVEQGSEDDLIDSFEAAGYRAKNTVIIADASGLEHGSERINGVNSYSLFRRRGWLHIFTPVKDRESNPPIMERVMITNSRIVTADGRRHFFAVPELTELVKAFARAPMKSGGMPDRTSPFCHRYDGGTYPLCRLYPRSGVRGRVAFEPVGRGREAQSNDRRFDDPTDRARPDGRPVSRRALFRGI